MKKTKFVSGLLSAVLVLSAFAVPAAAADVTQTNSGGTATVSYTNDSMWTATIPTYVAPVEAGQQDVSAYEVAVKDVVIGDNQQLAATIEVDISSEGAFQDFDAWVKQEPPLPDALFAENDIIAAAVIRVLKKHGYRVPDDVSVIGFDDIPMCEMLDPPLTTVHSFKEELGIIAVEHLDRRIRRGEVPHQMTSVGRLSTALSTCLVTRFSVKSR